MGVSKQAIKYHNPKNVKDFFRLLNDNNVKYVLTKNIAEELPAKLPVTKDIDLLVHPTDYERYKQLLKANGFLQIPHPHGKECGWRFLYNVHENCKFKHKSTLLEVDAYAELCTKSIVMNAWLPLDRMLNESVWQSRYYDKENGWWIMDDENQAIYLLARGLFEKHGFNAGYIMEIERRKALLYTTAAKEKLALVFFRFRDIMLEKIRYAAYQDIVPAYMSFVDY